MPSVPRIENPCPVARALHVVGERWTLLIVRDLLRTSPRRYQDFVDSLSGISPTLLSSRLKKLEEFDLLSRSEDPENGRPRYALTERGRALAPTVKALGDFGRYHVPS